MENVILKQSAFCLLPRLLHLSNTSLRLPNPVTPILYLSSAAHCVSRISMLLEPMPLDVVHRTCVVVQNPGTQLNVRTTGPTGMPHFLSDFVSLVPEELKYIVLGRPSCR